MGQLRSSEHARLPSPRVLPLHGERVRVRGGHLLGHCDARAFRLTTAVTRAQAVRKRAWNECSSIVASEPKQTILRLASVGVTVTTIA